MADYQNNTIKKHENTIEKREKLFADYLETVGFNAEPVLMTYPENSRINSIILSEVAKIPEYEFTTPDKVQHRLWCISDSATIAAIEKEFLKTEFLYIADGHHRSASSNLLAENLKKDENVSKRQCDHGVICRRKTFEHSQWKALNLF